MSKWGFVGMAIFAVFLLSRFISFARGENRS